jgi:hypothetical protein
MRKVILLLLALAACPFAAISTLTLPNEDINGVDTPQVVWVDQNFDSVKVRVNQLVDSANAYIPGSGVFAGSFLRSLTNLRLGIDFDANATGNYFWLSHNSADTLFRVRDDSTWRAFGAGTVTKVTASDTVIGAHLKTAGSLSVSGLAGIGNGTSANIGLFVQPQNTFTGNQQFGAWVEPVFTSSATTGGAALVAFAGTAATSFTQSRTRGVLVRAGSEGSGSTIDTLIGIDIESQAAGNHNFALRTGTGKVILGDTLSGTRGIFSGPVHADTLISAKFYTEGTFTLTGTGFATPPTGTARYTRVGKMVVLYIPTIQGTSNSTLLTYTGAPAAIQPARKQTVTIEAISDNTSTYYAGFIDVETDGTLTVTPRTSISSIPGAFTASGTKGITGATITYTLQ